MIVSNHARLAGRGPRQPHCGKCCGAKTKPANARNKRADRRVAAQQIKEQQR